MGCGFRHLTGFFGRDCLKRSITADQVDRYKSAPARPGILEAPAILIRDITERRERYCTDGTSACQYGDDVQPSTSPAMADRQDSSRTEGGPDI